MIWENLGAGEWRSAVAVSDAQDLVIDGFQGRPAVVGSDEPAIALCRVERAALHDCRAAPGTRIFLACVETSMREIRLANNELSGDEMPAA